jgi:hypothetical protein
MLAPTMNWPPDYEALMQKRVQLMLHVKLVPGYLRGARAHYASNGAEGCIDFIEEPHKAIAPCSRTI